MLLDSRRENFLQIVCFLISIPLPSEYRLLVVSHTDGFWLRIPMPFGQFYRLVLVRNTDPFWSVLPTIYGQLHRQISCKTQ